MNDGILKEIRTAKEEREGIFYSLSSMIDVSSILQGKGRHEGAEKSIRKRGGTYR